MRNRRHPQLASAPRIVKQEATGCLIMAVVFTAVLIAGVVVTSEYMDQPEKKELAK